MASRLRLARLGAAVLGASVALMVGALPASADSPNLSITGTVNGGVRGDDVVMDFADHGPVRPHQVQVWLENLRLSDGTVVRTYCAELTVELDSAVGMIEVPWNKYPDPNSPFNKNNTAINWVLHHSYPFVGDLGALGKAAGATTPLTVQQALAGTQAAIWHYSDDATLDKSQVNDAAANANITALYDYLTGSSNTGLSQPSTQPASPSVTVSPKSAKGTAPGEIGPFTVSSNLGTPLTVDTSGLPAGAKLTDGKGNAIDLAKVADGTKFYFDIPSKSKAGDAWVKVEGDLQVGRLFIGNDENKNELNLPFGKEHGNAHSNCAKPTQSLIVAQSTPAADTANVSWTPATTTSTTTQPTSTTQPTTSAPVVAPTTTTPPQVKNTGNELPNTGVDIIAPVALGIVLIGAGGAFLIFQRRRKRV